VDDEGKDGVQDLNLIPNPVIKFSYFVNAYESTMATATMTYRNSPGEKWWQ